jgi:tryptophanyl-tRNA synthetase
MTTPFDKETFQENVREVVLDYLAAGLDPEKSTIFVQSQVPEHIELAYLFGTTISIARLSHLPTYKEKVKQYPEEANLALLSYPVLMASDILSYKAEAVPVGDDQLPHLEVAREIARKMNEMYGMDFPEPDQYKTEGHYVPSLTGEGKMSKSVEGSYINLTDDLETIKEKIAKTPTDEGKGETIPEEGGVAALLNLVEFFEGLEKRKDYEKKYKGEGIKYSELKDGLAKAIFEELRPFQEKRKTFEKDTKLVERVLKDGSSKAREVAKETLNEVKKAMGIS